MTSLGAASGRTGGSSRDGSASKVLRSSAAWLRPIFSLKVPRTVYLSVGKGAGDVKLRDWATKFLDMVSGVTVVLKERVKKHPPVCQACHRPIGTCCHCGTPLSLTEEKGVDVAIATDMIKLAWEDAYDWAVLVSSDRDFIPAVEFLDGKGRKVLHAGFPPRGSELAAKCWGSLDLRSHLSLLERR